MKINSKVLYATAAGAAVAIALIAYYKNRSASQSNIEKSGHVLNFEQGFLTLDSVLIILQNIKMILPPRLRAIKQEFLTERLKVFETNPEAYIQTIRKYLKLQEEEIEKVCNDMFEKFSITQNQFDTSLNKYKASTLVNQDMKHLRPDTFSLFSRTPTPEDLTEDTLAKLLSLYISNLEDKALNLKGDFLSPIEKTAAQIESFDKVYRETGFDEIQIAAAISRYSRSDQIKLLYDKALKAEEALKPPMEVYSV